MCIGFGIDTLVDGRIGAQPDGIGVYVRGLSSALASCGDVDLVGFVHGARPLRLQAASGYPRTSHFSLPYAAAAVWSAATGRSFPSASRVGREIAVYHAPDLRIPKLARTPVVATVHDVIPLRYPQWANPRARALKNALMRRAARWADRVITASQAAARDISSAYGIAEDRIATVPNGIEAIWFSDIDETRMQRVLRDYDLRPGFYLTVGTLQPRKNIDRILDAYLSLPVSLRRERALVVVGREGWRAESLRARLEAVQSNGQVHWLQYVDTDVLRSLYRSARGLVFPSLSEGFGLPILEAFASGTPVVTSNVSALSETAGDAAIVVDPNCTEAIAAAMERLHEDDSLVKRLVESGRERVRGFTWEACAAATLAVYRSAA